MMRIGFALLCLATMISGCAHVSRFERGALVAFGEPINPNEAPLYYLIRIDVKETTEQRIMESRIRLAENAPMMSLADLRPDGVAHYLPLFSPPPQWPEVLKKKARESETYSGGGFHIQFKDDRLVYVGICSHCAGERAFPVVAAPDSQVFFTLPLTERQVEVVFGKPERIYKVREVTY